MNRFDRGNRRRYGDDREDEQPGQILDPAEPVGVPPGHLGALAAGTHQVRHPQLGQMLRHRRRGLADATGQICHRHLAITQ
jgi:hypothetical protein